MKLISIILTTLIMVSTVIIPQEWECATATDGYDYLKANNISVNARTIGAANIRIYVHKIARNDGTGAITDDEVAEMLDILIQDFTESNIGFVLEEIDQINNTYYFNYPDIHYANLFDENSHSDGIDIYACPAESYFNGGQAKSPFPSTALYVSGSMYGDQVATSSVLSHEMGWTITYS